MKGAWKLESWTGQVVRRVSEEGGGSGKEEKVARARGTGRDHGRGGMGPLAAGADCRLVRCRSLSCTSIISKPIQFVSFLFVARKLVCRNFETRKKWNGSTEGWS